MAEQILDLNSFKASGVYTIEIDQSNSIVVTSQTVRLIIGFSRQGPFNVPVFLSNVKNARTIFGNIDLFLERNGCFFHRTIEKCLEVGPVIALNLLTLNNDLTTADPDTTNYRSFSLDTVEHNGNVTAKLLASFYNKERFWFPEVDSFLATRAVVDQPKLLNFVNLGQQKMSILVLKSNILGYSFPAITWYGAGNVPSFMNEYDFIQDYFIDVYMIAGDWGPDRYAALSVDPIFSQYFTVDGLIASKLNDFISRPEVTVNGKFTGTIIPDFVDKNGSNQFIENIINPNTRTTGLFCSVNKDALDNIEDNLSKVDLIGHHLTSIIDDSTILLDNKIDMLSYKSVIKEENLYSQKSSYTTSGIAQTKVNNTAATLPFSGVWRGMSFDGLGSNAANIPANQLKNLVFNVLQLTSSEKNTLINGDYNSMYVQQFNSLYNTIETVKSRVYSMTVSATQIILTVDIEAVGSTYVNSTNTYQIGFGFDKFDIDSAALFPELTIPGSTPVFYAEVNSQTYLDIDAQLITTGDTILIDLSPRDYDYIKIDSVTKDISSEFVTVSSAPFIIPVKAISVYLDSDLTDLRTNETPFIAFGTAYSYMESDTTVSTVPAGELNIISLVANLNVSYPIILGSYNINSVQMNSTDVTGLSVGDYLVYDDGTRLTRIQSIKTISVGIVQVTTYEKIKVWDLTTEPIVQAFKSVDKISNSLDFTYLSGYQLQKRQMPNNTNAQMNNIYSVLTSTNLFNSLSDSDMITWRYLVDCFNHGLEPQSKAILGQLCKKKGKALALLNAPSVKEFINSTDPRFTDPVTSAEPKPLLQPYYISTGGNLDLNPSFTYSLPSEDNGGKYVSFFTPNFNILTAEGNSISVPPAMYVSNNFVRKQIDGIPFSIVAGKRRGVIGDTEVQGLEYDYSTDDRSFIEPFGLNPIIKKSGQFQIYANQTGYQTLQTALNNIHVRDILITIETAVEEILNNYVFEFNDANSRLEIESLVRGYMDGVQIAGGVYTYDLYMNTTNNTQEVIQSNAGVFDLIVQPVRGMHKLISRITVQNAGGTSTGGFTTV